MARSGTRAWASSLAAAGGSRGRALFGCHRAPPHPAALPALPLHQGRPGAARSLGATLAGRITDHRQGGPPQARSQVKVSFPALISVSATSLGKILSNVGGIWTKMGRSLFSRGLECSSKIKPGYTLLPLKRQPVSSPQ